MAKSTKISISELSPKDRINAMIETVEEAFGISITVRDRFGVVRLPSGEPMVDRRGMHYHPYCMEQRDKRSSYDKACNAYCAKHIAKVTAKTKQPFVSHCWKGVREVIVPIWRGGEQMLTLFAGGWKDPAVDTCPVEDAPQSVKEKYDALEVIDETSIQRISTVLTTLGLGLLDEVDALHGTASPGRGRINQIKEFIRHNAQQSLSLENLAEHLGLSPSRTSQVVKDLLHAPFQDLVIQERLARAKTLLIASERSQEDIATQCGFRSQHYFNRLFKKHVGIPPGRYRRENQQESD